MNSFASRLIFAPFASFASMKKEETDKNRNFQEVDAGSKVKMV